MLSGLETLIRHQPVTRILSGPSYNKHGSYKEDDLS